MPVAGAPELGPDRLLPALLACVLLSGNTYATAQDNELPADSIKAGFLYNFAKYTEWPNTASGTSSPLRLCAVSAAPLSGQLALLQGRRVGTRPLDVRLRVPAGEWSACHLIYLSHEDAGRIESVIKSLSGTSVLTIGDLPGFARQGGMIELVEMNNRMRFEINLTTARIAGLNMSSQMLKLASRIWQ